MSVPRLLWRRREAAEALNVSESTLDNLRKQGLIPTVNLGPRGVRFCPDELRRRIAELQAAPSK